MEDKRKRKGFLVAVAAVVVTGSVAAYLYFKGIPGKPTTAVESAKLVPDEALMATFISTDEQSWGKLRQFGTPEAQQAIASIFEEFQIGEATLNFERDLKPWVGGVMFALLPRQASASPEQRNVLMVVGIQNKLKALEFANQMKSQKQGSVEEKQYKGIAISNIKQPNGTSYSTAVLGDHLVLAFSLEAVEQAVDAFKGEPALASQPDAEAALVQAAGVQNRIAQVYVKDYAGFMQQLRSNSAPLPPATLKQFEQVKSMVMGVGVDGDGLRLKARASLDPALVKYDFQPVKGKVVSQFPAQTIALMSSGGVGKVWSDLMAQSKDVPEIQTAMNQIRQSIKSAVNLDADREVFGWMDGEFAVGLIPSQEGALAQLGVGGALMVQTSDRKQAEATVSKLEALVKRSAPVINFSQKDVGSIRVREWQIPAQGTLLGHGWLDGNYLFVAMGPLADAIAAKSGDRLDNSPSFKAITGSLPKSNQGLFYMDVEQSMSVLAPVLQASGTPFSPEASAVLNSIRGIGLTATWPDPSTSQMEMLFALKPKEK